MNWFDSKAIEQSKMKLEKDLSRFRNACVEAGNLHKKMKNVIHIAGTNGKGSTIAILQSILKESGFKVNTTTSPHLVKYNERINLNGSHIDNSYLNTIIDSLEDVFQKYELSFFEKSILCAFKAFAESDADFNIIETGIGGTLDATNVIESDKICVITSISFDHIEHLGDTIRSIADNKFGIIRDGNDLVLGYQSLNFEMPNGYTGGRDWFIRDNGDVTFDYNNLKNLTISLIGSHQYYNAGNALAVCDILKDKGFIISDDSIRKGLMNVKWPGRMQYLTENVLIDGAHNSDGILNLCRYLNNIDKPKVGIMATMRDKRMGDDIYDAIRKSFDKIYCVDIINDAVMDRVLPPKELCSMLNVQGIEAEYRSFNDISFLEKNTLFVIFGSLFLVSDILSMGIADKK